MKKEKILTSELLNIENELYSKTNILFNELIDYDSSREIKLKDFRLAELYSHRNKLDLFLSINFDLNSFEFISLIDSWDEVFEEMKETIIDDDVNTSWLHERYENYKSQHNIVDEMLRNHHASFND
ncbi:hypothetical protein [Tetragenococcus halophilus]|uniref:hypothetical protein n=1 Tax=Tetragenococcus halophilus TaxID=51669 RepID=UPI002A94285E|nr:hypothetical protein TEHSL10_11870 [Tetragenococcus halophilus]